MNAVLYGVDARAQQEVDDLTAMIDARVDDLVARGFSVAITDGKIRYRGRPELRLATLVRSAEEREDPERAIAQ